MKKEEWGGGRGCLQEQETKNRRQRNAMLLRINALFLFCQEPRTLSVMKSDMYDGARPRTVLCVISSTLKPDLM